jgi:hypothetical protein
VKAKRALNGVPAKQQTIERHYFDLFQKTYPLPSGTVIHGDKPDVILKGAQTIGIEITNFYVTDGSCSASEQVQRVRRNSAVSIAQRLYEQATGNNFQLSFSFNKDHPIRNQATLVKKLVELAGRVESGENGQISKAVFKDIPELEFAHLYAHELVYVPYDDPDFPNGQPHISEGFAAFRTYTNRREARALTGGVYQPLQFTAKWKLVQGHRFGLMSSIRLKEIIREKEAKAKQYTPCDLYWLLVVVEFIDSAQEQEIRLDRGVTVSSDIFQKVIVYKPHFEHVLEITPQPASTP